MEKDINTEWDAIAKYKEKVCFLFITNTNCIGYIWCKRCFSPIPSDKVVYVTDQVTPWMKVLSPDLSKATAHSCVVISAGGWRLNKWASSSLPVGHLGWFDHKVLESPQCLFKSQYTYFCTVCSHLSLLVHPSIFLPSQLLAQKVQLNFHHHVIDYVTTKGSLNWEIFSTGTSYLASSELRFDLF